MCITCTEQRIATRCVGSNVDQGRRLRNVSSVLINRLFASTDISSQSTIEQL